MGAMSTDGRLKRVVRKVTQNIKEAKNQLDIKRVMKGKEGSTGQGGGQMQKKITGVVDKAKREMGIGRGRKAKASGTACESVVGRRG